MVTGGRAMVDCLRREGVEHVFGIPGTQNLGVIDALRDAPDIRFILTRHEQGAAFMAYGFGRASGRPGVVTATEGPGVTNLGIDNTTWSDHTDIRPTLMVLLGLKDDYSHDGRALTEDLDGWARPEATRLNGGYARLAVIYKQIDAAVGQFGLVTLMVSTDGINGNDSLYAQKESQLSSLNSQRDALAAQMIVLLEGAEFNGQAITQQQAKALVAQGQALLGQANALLS